LARDVDAIIHQAARVSVAESIKDPALTNDVNVNGTFNMLKASVELDVKRVVYASSCAVYGDTEVMPIKEDCLPKPKITLWDFETSNGKLRLSFP